MSRLTTDRKDERLREVDSATNMQKAYLVLSEDEIAKGFVRPVRRSYTHLLCGASTSMAERLCETYARDPGFYGGTYCARCRDHFPLLGYNSPKPIEGSIGDWGYFFVWDEDGEGVGS